MAGSMMGTYTSALGAELGEASSRCAINVSSSADDNIETVRYVLLMASLKLDGNH